MLSACFLSGDLWLIFFFVELLCSRLPLHLTLGGSIHRRLDSSSLTWSWIDFVFWGRCVGRVNTSTMAIKNLLPLHKKDAHAPAASGEPKAPHLPRHHQTSFITNRWRNELVAAAAEFAGTFMFLFFAFGGTSVANTAATYSDAATAGQESGSITQAPNTSVLLYISLAFGFSLMVNVWVFFRVSGGLFNPAVSLPQTVCYMAAGSRWRRNDKADHVD